MMKRSFRDKWADELDSGRRTQGEGYLRKSANGVVRECCLGVALDIAGIEPLDDAGDTAEWVGGVHYPHPDDYAAMGLNEQTMRDLANRNDGSCSHFGKPQTFTEIAAHLRTLPVIED